MAIQVASLFALLSLKDEMTPALDRSRQGLSNLGGTLQSVGAKATLVTAPLAAGLGVATNSAIGFDETVTNIAVLLGTTRGEAQDLGRELLQIGRNTRGGPQAVAEAFEEIAGGVQDASTHMDILNASIAAAEAGNANLAATTGGMVSVMNAYGFEAEKAAWVSDVLTQTVGMGVGSMEQFVGALGPASGLAYDVGIGFDELAASAAFLTSTGGSASESVTQLTGIMSAFLKPNESMKSALKEMGYESGTAALQNLGLAGAVQALSESVGGSTDKMAQALGTQEALGGAIGLLTERAGEFTDDFIEGLDGVTDAARDIQLESAAAQFDLLKSDVEALGIEVGTALLPALVGIVDEVRPVIAEIVTWAGENPELLGQIVMITGALIAAGPIIAGVGTAMSVASGIVGTATTVFNIARGAVMALGGGMMGAIGPIIAVGAAVAGVIAAINEFNRVNAGIQESAGNAQQAYQESGMSRADMEALVFDKAVEGYGGGIWGDFLARATHHQLVQGVETGEFHFIDTRATGGPVTGGEPYLVGEEGPELFMPSTNGHIVDAQRTASAFGGLQIGNITIYANSEAEGRAAARGFQAQLDELLMARG